MDDLQLGNGTGNRGLTISSGTSAFGTLAFGDSSDGSGTDRYSGSVEYYHGDNSMRFYTNTAEQMRIIGDGSLRIFQATTNIPGVGNTTVGAAFEKTASGGSLFVSRSDNTPAHFNRNSDGGLVRFYRSGTEEGHINVTTSGVTLVSTSDYRLKENVTELSHSIERLKLLTPRRFNFITEPSQTIDGFIAHELSDAVPEAVFGEKDAMEDQEVEVTPAVLSAEGEVTTEAVMETKSVISPQGIDQGKLVPLLTAALQEAIAKIETLEQRLSAAGIA
jgi:hypothetical protein